MLNQSDINLIKVILRLGLYYGYRISKGGVKTYEKDCLKNSFLGKHIVYHIFEMWLLNIQLAYDMYFSTSEFNNT